MNIAENPQGITIPDGIRQSWQAAIDTLARTSGFLSALIMRADPKKLEVCVASNTEGNPFKQGDQTDRHTDIYCERVLATRMPFHCPDALKLDPPWLNPEVIDFGLACYYGMPIFWPNGTPFGTICILEKTETSINADTRVLMDLFRQAIEMALVRLSSATAEIDASSASYREVEGRYAAVFEQAGVGIARVRLEGGWLDVNDKLCDIVGYTRAELLTMTWQDITYPDDVGPDAAMAEKVARGEIPSYTLDKRYFHKQGHIVWIRLTVTLVRDSQGAPMYFVIIVEDITETKALQKSVEQAQKLEAMGRLVGNIAHEFNNKLAAISGSLVLARRIEKIHSTNITNAENLCFQASEMIRGLLTYARREHTDYTVLQLGDYLTTVMSNIKRVYPETIALDIDICDQPTPVKANATQIQQVIFNLMNNARDAVEDAAHPMIGFRLYTIDTSEDFMARHDVSAGKLVVLEVRDNGVGIPPTEIEKIFDPFFTTKPVDKGSGLGLAMVASLVQQHGGAIEVESNPRTGTRFLVFLPLSTDEAPVEPVTVKTEVSSGNATVLLVDDDQNVLEITGQVLRSLGYSVKQARNGKEALAIYENDADSIDCVLSDVTMPTMGGVELHKRLKAYDSDVRMIFMTGYGETAEMEVTPCPVLFKPIAEDALTLALNAVLNG